MRRIYAALVAGSAFVGACAPAGQTAVQPVSATPGPAGATNQGWVANTALYEVFVRDFSPTGNFRGVIDGLDRIQATGANVVWLMPIHPIGVLNRKDSLGSSYSVRDYHEVNPDYGTKDDFRALVQAAHARNLKVILDWVPNHTAWDHRWATEHPEFYTRDEQGRMSVPRDADGKLTDWTDVADLNYADPGLRRAMIGEMRYWLDEFGIDGFRVDVAAFVPDDFWREAVPQLRAGRSILLLAEWDAPKMHDLGFDLTYSWPSYSRLKDVWKGGPASSFVDAEIADVRSLPNGGMRMRFSTNHDETAWDQPPVTLFGGAAGARAAFLAMALLPGTPLLYNGQEVESPQKLGLFVREPVAWAQPGADAARAFYRHVIDLERTHPAFASGELAPVQTDQANDVIAYRRGDAVVLVNTRPRPVRVTPAGVNLNGARDLLAGGTHQGASVSLPAHGAMVLEIAGS